MTRDQIVDFINKFNSLTEYPLSKMLNNLKIGKPKFYEWKKRYGMANKHNGHIPKDKWITPNEKKAIIDYYKDNPLNGVRRLSYMMMDENIAYVSANTIHRVLKKEGLMEIRTLPISSKGKGFDQPVSVHQQWHIDVSYINISGTFYYLCSIIDGYSRFLVHWDLKESMKEEDIEIVVQEALEKNKGCQPRLISDNGPQFKAKDFKEFIRFCGMEHTFTRPYYPESNGKIERWFKELKQNCIRPFQPQTLADAKKYITNFIEIYNYKRLHSAIGYVTPYDKLLGLENNLFKERKEKLVIALEKRKFYWKQKKQKDLALAS